MKGESESRDKRKSGRRGEVEKRENERSDMSESEKIYREERERAE